MPAFPLTVHVEAHSLRFDEAKRQKKHLTEGVYIFETIAEKSDRVGVYVA